MRIDFIFDTVCIWSYIAKRRLDSALREFPKIKISLIARPFFILPSPFFNFPLPPEVSPNAAQKTKILRDKVADIAQNEGIVIDFDNLPPVTDSKPSHMLIQEAFRQNKGNDVMEDVFRSYFCQARDISDFKVLKDIADKNDVILPDEENDFFKNTPNFLPMLPAGWKKSAIRAVPCMIFDKETMIFGAQSVIALKKMIELSSCLKKELKQNI